MNFNTRILDPYEKMVPGLWGEVDHFKMDEGGRNAFGDPLEMSIKLIYWLDVLRELVNTPINIHCGYATSGHKRGSTHYSGLAVDIHAVGMNAVSLLWAAMQLPFNGLGLYKHWRSPGIHVDVRTLGMGEGRKQWIYTRGGVYRNLKRMDMMFDI